MKYVVNERRMKDISRMKLLELIRIELKNKFFDNLSAFLNDYQ